MSQPLVPPAFPITDSRAWRIGAWAVLLVFFAVASIRVVKHQSKYPAGDGDWGVYYRAGLAMRHRQPIYTLDHGPLLTFKNAPVVALLLAPVSILPVGVARWVWLLGDFIGLGLIYRLAGRVIFGQRTPRPAAQGLIAGAILLDAHFIMDQLFSGPTTVYVLLLTVASFVWAWEGKGVRAGIALALAILMKIVPLAFVPWLLVCRRPWLGAGSLILSLFVMMLLPALWIGWQPNLQLARQWPRHLAATETPEQEYRLQNQSLQAMLTRSFTRVHDPKYHANIAKLDPKTIKIIWLATSLILAAMLYGVITWQMRKVMLDGGAALSLLLLYMTLCNPLAWRYNYIALGVPYLYLLYSLWKGTSHRRLIITCLIVSYVFHWLPDAGQIHRARFWARRHWRWQSHGHRPNAIRPPLCKS